MLFTVQFYHLNNIWWCFSLYNFLRPPLIPFFYRQIPSAAQILRHSKHTLFRHMGDPHKTKCRTVVRQRLWTKRHQTSPGFNLFLNSPRTQFWFLVPLQNIWILPYFISVCCQSLSVDSLRPSAHDRVLRIYAHTGTTEPLSVHPHTPAAMQKSFWNQQDSRLDAIPSRTPSPCPVAARRPDTWLHRVATECWQHLERQTMMTSREESAADWLLADAAVQPLIHFKHNRPAQNICTALGMAARIVTILTAHLRTGFYGNSTLFSPTITACQCVWLFLLPRTALKMSHQFCGPPACSYLRAQLSETLKVRIINL